MNHIAQLITDLKPIVADPAQTIRLALVLILLLGLPHVLRVALYPHCDAAAFTVKFSSYLADDRALTNKLNLMRTSPPVPFPVALHKLISLGFLKWPSGVNSPRPGT